MFNVMIFFFIVITVTIWSFCLSGYRWTTAAVSCFSTSCNQRSNNGRSEGSRDHRQLCTSMPGNSRDNSNGMSR